jgi:S1-C subfamily serine protease
MRSRHLRRFAVACLFPLLLACRADPFPDEPFPGDSGVRTARGGFSGVVQTVLPTITFIQTEATLPPGLERILPPGRTLPDQPTPVGIGSGVFFRDDGYILTNNHVVQDAERVLVVLHDRRFFEAEVVGRDPSTEIAVIRIDGSGFPAARFGDSDRIEVGEWVLAMGSPLDMEFRYPGDRQWHGADTRDPRRTARHGAAAGVPARALHSDRRRP